MPTATAACWVDSRGVCSGIRSARSNGTVAEYPATLCTGPGSSSGGCCGCGPVDGVGWGVSLDGADGVDRFCGVCRADGAEDGPDAARAEPGTCAATGPDAGPVTWLAACVGAGTAACADTGLCGGGAGAGLCGGGAGAAAAGFAWRAGLTCNAGVVRAGVVWCVGLVRSAAVLAWTRRRSLALASCPPRRGCLAEVGGRASRGDAGSAGTGTSGLVTSGHWPGPSTMSRFSSSSSRLRLTQTSLPWPEAGVWLAKAQTAGPPRSSTADSAVTPASLRARFTGCAAFPGVRTGTPRVSRRFRR
jgi:hypothetical protein